MSVINYSRKYMNIASIAGALIQFKVLNPFLKGRLAGLQS